MVQFHVNVVPHVFVHPLNVYVYCAVGEAGVAVTVVLHIVNLSQLVDMLVHQSPVTDSLFTLPYPFGAAFIVTVYVFTSLIKWAVYVAQVVTGTIVGVHVWSHVYV